MSDSMPLFSICIPVFNHEKYVGQTIQSVLDQDFEGFEIVVADNCSTDGSLTVVKSFDDPRICIIENRYNIGFAPNLQKVTRFARGKFINLLSSDDIMESGSLKAYADIINQFSDSDQKRLVLSSQTWQINESGAVTCYITKTHSDFAPRRVTIPTSADIEAQPYFETFEGRKVFAQCMANLNTMGMFCSTIYSREIWEAVEGYNSTQLFNPDMDFILKALAQDPIVIYVNRPLYRYRRHSDGQAAQQARSKVLKQQVDYYNYLVRFDEKWLAGTGVTQDHQRQLFLERDCLNHALVALANGQWIYATQLTAFAWSTYPHNIVRLPRFYMTLLLLLGGPLGVFLIRAVRKMQQRPMPSLSELTNST